MWMQCPMYWKLSEYPTRAGRLASVVFGKEQVHDWNIWGKECHLSVELLYQFVEVGLWGAYQGERVIWYQVVVIYNHNHNNNIFIFIFRDRLLFDQIPFRQLCVNWFVGVLNPVERVDLVEGYKQLFDFSVFGKTCYLFYIYLYLY